MAIQIIFRQKFDPIAGRSFSPSRVGASSQTHNEQGSALVECALSSLILLSVLFGIIAISLAAYSGLFVSDAARQGTRYAIVRGSTCSTYSANLSNCNVTSSQIQTYLRGLAFPGIDSSNLTAATSWYAPSSSSDPTWTLCSSGTCNLPGNMVKVTVTYTFPLSIPNIPSSSLTLKSSSRMVIAQ